jgi:DNA-binding NtrC family response regulator
MSVNQVLVVDDEQYVCKALRKFFEGKGYTVLEAFSGEEALETYKRERPNVVMLDIRMPGMDGLETLRELKSIDPGVSVIMITAVHEENIALEAMGEGAFDYITKPVDPNYLELSLLTKMTLADAEW